MKIKNFISDNFILLIVLLLGFVWTFTFPLYETNDESNHFIRAYEISEGKIFTHQKPVSIDDIATVAFNGCSNEQLDREQNFEICYGSILPKSIADSYLKFFYDRSGPDVTHSTLKYNLENPIPLDKNGEQILYPNRQTTAYSPIPYLAPALAITLLQPFNPTVSTLFYMSRIANVLLATFLLWLTLRIAYSSSANVKLVSIYIAIAIGALSKQTALVFMLVPFAFQAYQLLMFKREKILPAKNAKSLKSAASKSAASKSVPAKSKSVAAKSSKSSKSVPNKKSNSYKYYELLYPLIPLAGVEIWNKLYNALSMKTMDPFYNLFDGSMPDFHIYLMHHPFEMVQKFAEQFFGLFSEKGIGELEKTANNLVWYTTFKDFQPNWAMYLFVGMLIAIAIYYKKFEAIMLFPALMFSYISMGTDLVANFMIIISFVLSMHYIKANKIGTPVMFRAVSYLTAFLYFIGTYFAIWLIFTPEFAGEIWGVQGRYFVVLLPIFALLSKQKDTPKYVNIFFIFGVVMMQLSIILSMIYV
ncbi:MAG: DUF2142 domain-containing protein [Bifidobacteriaceae bacterium]|nr:DUF2142 domain-containing protein [Bifidobacteriaceae bacterium]